MPYKSDAKAQNIFIQHWKGDGVGRGMVGGGQEGRGERRAGREGVVV